MQTAVSTTSSAAQAGFRYRLAGIDAARGLALIGMLMVHFGPEDGAGLAGLLYGLPHGRASILFALVAGIGMALVADGRAGPMAGRLRLVCYAAVLLPLGLALQVLDHPVSVIIHHYAAFFVLGAVVVGFSRGTIFAMAIVMTVLGPAVYLAGQVNWPGLFDRDSVELGQGIEAIFTGLLISGPYPLLTWSAPILWGVWLGGADLRASRLPFGMLTGGLGATALAIGLSMAGQALFGAPGDDAGWRDLLSSAAHSQMPLWIVQAVGIAAAVVGLCLLVGRFMPVIIAPLALLGSMTLSVYTAHLLALTLFPDVLRSDRVSQAALTTLAFVIGATVFAFVWRPFGRGPVEMLLQAVWSLVRPDKIGGHNDEGRVVQATRP